MRIHLRATTIHQRSSSTSHRTTQHAAQGKGTDSTKAHSLTEAHSHVFGICDARPAALPTRLHGVLHCPDLRGKLGSPAVNRQSREVKLELTWWGNSASAMKGAPTAKSSCTSRAPRIRSRAARRRSLRASSPLRTRQRAGSPNGSAWTTTSRACTPSRSRASSLTRSGLLSRRSTGYSTSRKPLPTHSRTHSLIPTIWGDITLCC